jgi:hypothetical protein
MENDNASLFEIPNNESATIVAKWKLPTIPGAVGKLIPITVLMRTTNATIGDS